MERRLAAILAADVAGYSRLMGEDEEATLRTLRDYRSVMDREAAAHGGRVFGRAGDSVIIEFASAVEAVRCAIAIQRELERQNADLAQDRRMLFRIGVNFGDVMAEDGDLLGDAVNLAARVQALAPPGGICVSEDTYRQVRNKLPVGFEDLGQQHLKNIAEPVRIYRLLSGPSAAKLPAARNRPGRARWIAGGAAAALAAAIVFVLWGPDLRSGAPPRGTPPSEGAVTSPDRPAILVLPFKNLSGDPQQDYFSDGITEDVIAALTKFPGVLVLGRHTSFAQKDRALDVGALSRELGVRYLLDGDVRRSGDRIRISVELIEAASGRPRWAERYDRQAGDVFAIQDDVTQRVVGTLVSQIGRSEVERTQTGAATNLQAYELTLRGRALWLQSTKESIPAARQLLEEAIALDPGYAAAHVYAAFTYLTSYNNTWNQEFGAQGTIERMAELARQAIRLDGTYALAHATYGVALVFLGKHVESLAEVEHAIALNPNDPDVLGRAAQVLVFAGQHARAVEIVNRAIELDPFTPAQWLNYLSRAYYFLGDDAAAARTAKSCVETAPLRPCIETMRAASGQMGDAPAARAALAELQAANPEATATGAVKRLRQVFAKPEDLDRLIEGLRKAGLPE